MKRESGEAGAAGKAARTFPAAKAPDDQSGLRRRAEAMLLKQHTAQGRIPPIDAQRTVHELEVHQIELEMQNDELSRTHRDLETSSEKYFDLYDLAPVGYVTLNEKGIILESNFAAAVILGMERSKLVKQPFTRFILREDQDSYYLCRKQLVETHTQQACEMRLVRKDGTPPFWVRIDISSARVIDGTTRTRMVIVDISKRKHAERREALLTEILGILNDPPTVDDAVNSIVTAIKRETGLDAVGIRLRCGDDFPYVAQDGFSKKFYLAENKLAARTRDGGISADKDGNISLECTCGLVISGQTDPTNSLFTPRGSCWTNESSILLDVPIAQNPRFHPRNRCIHEGFHSVALVPLRAGKQIIGLLQLNDHRPNQFMSEMIFFFEDLGVIIGIALARKQAEEQIRVLNDQLKSRVAELDSANKELEAFSSSVSHDLRAPLRHMTGFVNLLKQMLKDHPDKKTHYYADTISEASTKMSMIIEDLLNFSRLGRAHIRKEKIKINTLIREVIGEIQAGLEDREIRWEIDELPDVYGDQPLLRLVLVNLISNAVKYTGNRPHAEIEIGYKEDKDETIVFVKDNGAGFDMKYVDKLFGVFQRLHTQAEFEGTGIGLANVRRIISRHCGRTWAEGVVGQGATFYFMLPKTKDT